MVLNLETFNPERFNLDFLNLEHLNPEPFDPWFFDPWTFEPWTSEPYHYRKNADRNLEKLRNKNTAIEKCESQLRKTPKSKYHYRKNTNRLRDVIYGDGRILVCVCVLVIYTSFCGWVVVCMGISWFAAAPTEPFCFFFLPLILGNSHTHEPRTTFFWLHIRTFAH